MPKPESSRPPRRSSVGGLRLPSILDAVFDSARLQLQLGDDERAETQPAEGAGDRGKSEKVAADQRRIYQFKVALRGARPPVWRRLQTRDGTLDQLHRLAWAAFGWTDSHSELAGSPEAVNPAVTWNDLNRSGSGAGELRMSQFLPVRRQRDRWEFDPAGDGRRVLELTFEGRVELQEGAVYPRCLEGEGVAPERTAARRAPRGAKRSTRPRTQPSEIPSAALDLDAVTHALRRIWLSRSGAGRSPLRGGRLPPAESQRLLRLFQGLLGFVNDHLQLAPELDPQKEWRGQSINRIAPLRNAVVDQPDWIDRFVAENPWRWGSADLEVVSNWRHLVFGEFLVVRHLKACSLFFRTKYDPTVYAVRGPLLTMQETLGDTLPMMVETALLPYAGGIVCDGLITIVETRFVPMAERMLGHYYRLTRRMYGVVESLPAPARPATNPAWLWTTDRWLAWDEQRPDEDVLPELQEQEPPPGSRVRRPLRTRERALEASQKISERLDRLCDEHGAATCGRLCRQLADLLATDCAEYLCRGRIEIWAAAIVRTIAWLNGGRVLPIRPLTLPQVDDALGVGHGTAAQKSVQIRNLLKLDPSDDRWRLW